MLNFKLHVPRSSEGGDREEGGGGGGGGGGGDWRGVSLQYVRQNLPEEEYTEKSHLVLSWCRQGV